MKALNLALVTGGKLALLFRGASGGQSNKARLRLTFALDDKNGKRKLDGTINHRLGRLFPHRWRFDRRWRHLHRGRVL